MSILCPDTVGNLKLFDLNIDKTSIFEPPLQLWSRTDFITCLPKRPVYFIVILLKTSTVVTTVFRVRVTVPVLEFDPSTRLD